MNVLFEIRKFGLHKFGTLKEFAVALDIAPQNLNAYLQGKRNLGKKFIDKLTALGFDYSKKNNTFNNQNLNNIDKITLDINGTIELINTPLDRLAILLGTSKETIESWQNGSINPDIIQLTKLYNIVIALGIARKESKIVNKETAFCDDIKCVI